MKMTKEKAESMINEIIRHRGFEDEFTIHFIRCIECFECVGLEKFESHDIELLYEMCLHGVYNPEELPDT